VQVIENPDRITPKALNRAIAASRGEYILRIDAHSVIEPGYIPAIIDFLEENPSAWGAGGRMDTEPESDGPFARAITTVLRHRFGVGNSSFRTGSESSQPCQVDTVFNCCWRREVFERVGLFHEQLARSQDIEMSSRICEAGGALWLVPTARTTYFARPRFWEYMLHNWSNGIWSVVPAMYLGRLPVRWRHLVPLAFVATLLGSAVLAAVQPWLCWLALAPALPYAIVNLAASFGAAWHARSLRLAITMPVAFAGLHLAYGAGSLWGAARVLAHAFRSAEPRIAAPVFTSEI